MVGLKILGILSPRPSEHHAVWIKRKIKIYIYIYYIPYKYILIIHVTYKMVGNWYGQFLIECTSTKYNAQVIPSDFNKPIVTGWALDEAPKDLQLQV